ncbi:ATP-dependent protease La [Mycoplasma wenyonii str. Massachusetts]|uniref:Lon protease n=1 Tax=Mycoplasma wenyonii (strain Massachusetts) TaxID=1197325 RepID=I6YAX0_MYCWM|nr:endopeptidase La [Mycoplasma wenyonii]AFN65116.1 ATP-dependent protease La [Mycoplasma wenyonii str. Massachusetts]
MTDSSNLQAFNNALPLLISRNLVVFPFTKSVIEVGRECSLASIKYSLSECKGELIILAQKDYDIDFPLPVDLYRVGTLSKVSVLKEHKDGSLTVKVEGLQRVKIDHPKITRKTGYEILGSMWFANYELLKERNTSFLKNKSDIEQLFKYFEELFDVKGSDYEEIKQLFTAEKTEGSNKDSCCKLIDKLCSFWPQGERDGVEIKQKWLEELSVSRRITLMLDYEYLSEAEKDEINSSISKKVNRNISKQQREFYLRERIKVIKEELGEGISRDGELQKFRDWLKKEKAPEHIKERVKEEIKKLEYSSVISSNESLITHTYLTWLISLPWDKSSKDQKVISKVQKELDKNHYGLDKAKERILEFVAVQKKTKNLHGTIICLSGPPGVGKTSLAQSIAKGLKRECVKISLGGLSDEAEIRGHRKTYIGAMPGRIIKGLKQAKVNNPVLILDEIDKIVSSGHGDPLSALLEVLDPKQNDKFVDNYIEEEVDLSKIMFIATANYEDNIPEALLDRLEIIRLTSYTEKEKLAIAKNGLINEVLEEHGLKEEELIFSDEAITYIIQRYTREAGVRNLRQCLSQIARKFIQRQELDKELKELKVEVEVVREYLSKEKYEHTVKDELSIPGVVNGMAYTEYGGDLLPVEINYYSGKGNLILTGNLRDTMKESASVALSYIKANESEFKLGDTKWSDIDINLHVPTGGVPKDGPSAGITITTAILSAFRKVPIPSNIAMTGEMTLRGKVLPIGGLKEKVISAVRGGVDTIFYPKESERHLEDIPEEILSKIRLKPIRHYSELYKELFSNK